MEAKQWTVQIHLTEAGGSITARAVLATSEGLRRVGIGHARRNAVDAGAPAIADQLAVSRALAELADKLAVIARHDIAALFGFPDPSRSWRTG